MKPEPRLPMKEEMRAERQGEGVSRAHVGISWKRSVSSMVRALGSHG